ncbi:Plant peroxidase [Macleaya cordata]|uniref:Peroxidase n=1 Tax=Macleaya cordata TaxID=56857 RepID=A0A200PLW3_MACCD|nr:Plant peroxidase [Macleaya cordata]
MKMNNTVLVGLTLGLALILVNFTTFSYAQLQFGFYKGKCKDKTVDVEAIVTGIIKERIKTDSSIVAALLRMQFHDCFVKGCDASLLLDGSASEKTAPPNLSVRGYELINDIKVALENQCGFRTVSCADIIVMATRDAVSESTGNIKFRYEVPTGRMDGKVSLATNVDLPSPRITVKDSIIAFGKKKLSSTEMVLLLGGGHTVGITHCSLFKYRLYSYNATHKQDPTMDKAEAEELKTKCHVSSDTDNVPIDLDQTPGNSLLVDNGFYKQIQAGRGILEIDQALALDKATMAAVNWFSANAIDFLVEFGKAMVKLGNVDVLTGNGPDREIREKCGAINSSAPASSGPLNLLP